MGKSRSLFVAKYLLKCLVSLILVSSGNSQRLHLPVTSALVDQTSFIVRFDDGIAAHISIAALQADTDDAPATARTAAEQVRTAAAKEAVRLVGLAKKKGIDVQILDTYGHVMSGMAVKVATPEEGVLFQELLMSDAAVQAVQPVVKYQVDLGQLRRTTTEVPAAATAAAAAAAAATAAATNPAADPTLTDPQIWGGADQYTLVDLAQSAYSGAGVRVAVIDNGIDYTHPAFGGCTAVGTGEGCRVVAGHDFTDGDSKTYDLCGSHGTHVAGIIAGDSTAVPTRTVPWRGVAYKAQLGAYRVFDCSGMTRNTWLLSALEQAVRDGMTIINLSMGTSWTAPLGVTFTSRLARQGVMVVAAAGNDGAEGLWTYGAPASEPDSFAVGSTDNTYSLGAALTVDATITVRTKTTNILAATARAMMNSPMFNLPRSLVLPQPNEACARIQNKAAVAGKVAVVPVGGCSESHKATNLVAAGAASVIFYGNLPYPAFKQSLNIDESIGRHAPQMFFVDRDTGTAVAKLLLQGKTVNITKVSTHRYLNPNAERPSAFSSWGPEAHLQMLPTFAAPGGGLLSSIPGNNFALYQGTSMATPYAAGALALWSQAKSKTLTGSGKRSRRVLDAAKAAFINTAMPIRLGDHESLAFSVVQAGAGIIQVKSALDNKLSISPTYLSLPTGQTDTVSTITLTNTGSQAVTYKLGHIPAVAISTEDAWYGLEQQEKLAATVRFTAESDDTDITTMDIQPSESKKIKAVITTSEALRASPMFYSGYLTFTPVAPYDAAAAASEVAGRTSSRRLLQRALEDPAAAAGSTHTSWQDDELGSKQSLNQQDGELWYPPLSVPYLSLSQPYSTLTALAAPKADDPQGRLLIPEAAYLCSVVSGSCAMTPEELIETDLQSMQVAACTFYLPLARPVDGAYIKLYAAANPEALLGTIEINKPIPWGGPKVLIQLPDLDTGSHWTGQYIPAGSNSSKATGKITVGTYKFVVVFRRPVAFGDQQAAETQALEYLQTLSVMGRLRVSRQRRGDEDGGWVPIGSH